MDPSFVHGERGCRGREGESPADTAARLASYLADRLDDRASLAFYEMVTDVVPEVVIRTALTRALDLSAAEIRRSRAAYFTAIVKPYLRAPRA